ncbi:MAG: hypothetical protein C5B49_08740 [Bdellovibrio sp.]|nr:MAG: hypothetical protein C5B49_08740 [Bdellovibrio sp.]
MGKAIGKTTFYPKFILSTVLAFNFICCGLSSNAEAQTTHGKFGAGFMIGTLVSINGKYWFSDRSALDFGLAFNSPYWNMLYADYLWHLPGLFGSSTQFGRQSVGYVGVGGGLGFWNRRDCNRWGCSGSDNGTGVALRGFFGAEWTPAPNPLGVFAEIGPTIGLTPATVTLIDLAVGLRYYF